MTEQVISIWHSRNKNQSGFLEKGERLVIRLERVKGKKLPRISMTRQFFNHPSWEDAEICRFTVNRKVLKDMITAIKKMEELL